MKKITFLLLVITCISYLQAQQTNEISLAPTNNVSLNYLSEGMGLSVGYDHYFHSKKKTFLTFAIGIQINLIEANSIAFFSGNNYITNTHYSLNIGKQRGHFEVGLGAGWGKKLDLFINERGEVGLIKKYFTEPYFLIAYRFIPLKKKNVSFRISVSTPYMRGSNNVLHFIGGGVGYSF